MELLLARTIVETLSKEINPLTGQILSKIDICSNEVIQEALIIVLEACTIESNEQLLKRLREEEKHNKIQNKRMSYPNYGKPWTEKDDLKVIQLNQQYNIWYTAKVLGRSPGSIKSKLEHLGIIPNKKRLKK